MKFKDMSYKELEKDFKEKLDQYSDEELVNSLSEMEDIKEKTADEMFEELGYKVIKNNFQITYVDNISSIQFLLQYKKIEYHFLRGTTYRVQTMQELQAINKKCQELRLVRR